MSEKHTIQLKKIIEIYEGIKSIQDNNHLDTKVSYRIARLSDKCRGIIETFEKQRDKIRDKYIAENKDLNANADNLTDQQKAEVKLKIAEINKSFDADIASLLNEFEEIEIYGFQISDFESKEIPLKFFIAMGDLIKD